MYRNRFLIAIFNLLYQILFLPNENTITKCYKENLYLLFYSNIDINQLLKVPESMNIGTYTDKTINVDCIIQS